MFIWRGLLNCAVNPGLTDAKIQLYSFQLLITNDPISPDLFSIYIFLGMYKFWTKAWLGHR